MSELRECPFCGGEAKVFGDAVHQQVRCLRCYAQSIRALVPEAVAAWNLRAELSAGFEAWLNDYLGQYSVDEPDNPDELARAAYAAGQASAGQWVRAEERLPDPYRPVLVAGGAAIIDRTDLWRTLMEPYEVLDDAAIIHWKVTRWRPLD